MERYRRAMGHPISTQALGKWLYNSWKAVNEDSFELDRSSRFSIGYQSPSGLFSIGKRELDVKGFLLKPIIGTGYSNIDGNHGMYVSPGLHLQLPFFGSLRKGQYRLQL